MKPAGTVKHAALQSWDAAPLPKNDAGPAEPGMPRRMPLYAVPLLGVPIFELGGGEGQVRKFEVRSSRLEVRDSELQACLKIVVYV